jgi:4-diphosphocytidyl-2-C-methyl-D-erythritol kinase
MSMLTLKAYAKVNLTLEVLGRRDDGYHDIVSILQTISLCDTIALELSDDVSLICDRPELESPDNLALKAAHLLKEASGCDKGVRVRLQKGIPVSAGLGGGSSDAAATLRGLNQLWGLGMALEDLAHLAARLGSDVSFFLHGGTAMVSGRGERVRPLPPADLEWLVLLAPDIEMESKTAALYGRLRGANFTRGALTRKLEARIRGGGDVPPQFLFNAFDDIAFDAFPGLKQYWDALYSLGAREIHLAGSGPSLFAPVSRKEVGTAIELLLRHKHGWNAHLGSRVKAEDSVKWT